MTRNATKTAIKPESKKAATKRRQLEATAYHEAGHAVVAIELKRAINSVTIVEGDDYSGQATMQIPSWVTKERASTTPGQHRDLVRKMLREMTIRLAGMAAEHRYTGRWNWIGAGADLRFFSAFAPHIAGPEENMQDRLRADMLAEATRIISTADGWTKVRAVADALLEHGTLSGTRVRAICRQVAV